MLVSCFDGVLCVMNQSIIRPIRQLQKKRKENGYENWVRGGTLEGYFALNTG